MRGDLPRCCTRSISPSSIRRRCAATMTSCARPAARNRNPHSRGV